jgi:RES domain-containing protein
MYSPVDSDNTNLLLMDAFEAGEMLDELVQEDWDVFSERLLGLDAAMDLLEAILHARYREDEWLRRQQEAQEYPFDRLELYTSRQNPADYTLADAWEEHRQEVIDSGGAAGPFSMSPANLARSASTLPTGSVIHRARNGYNLVEVGRFNSHKEPYRGDEIGAPSASSIRVGRANRVGQRVMYAADQEDTAIAEVRPARGFIVTIGEFRAKRDLNLLDLVRAPAPINPFTEPSLAIKVELNSLFHAFGHDLSTPLDRNDDTTAYLPSQSLTDAVRDTGFHGIRYPSAMQPGGSNIVLFDPADVEFVSSKLVTVTSVGIEFEPTTSS